MLYVGSYGVPTLGVFVHQIIVAPALINTYIKVGTQII